MKALRILFLAHFFCLTLWSPQSTAKESLNRLNWVEIVQTNFSTQIMFDFSNPIHFQKKITNGQAKIDFSFPGMKISSFNAPHVIEKISKLKASGLLEQVEVTEQVNPIAVVLSLTFATQRTISIKGPKNKIKKRNIQNKLLIKWNKIQDETDNRLILDIFPLEALKAMQKKESPIILEARNDVISDVTPQKQPHPQEKKNMRIVIDAGHGGNDKGAGNGNGLYEKDITLSIAKKTRKHLKKAGYTVLLTRNDDVTLTLSERTELAHQMKADLFVSIHVNARPASHTRDPSGIETYYLYAQDLLPPSNQRGFFFINQPKNKSLIKLLDSKLQKNITGSKQLATSIQANLINFLQHNNVTVYDRGVRKSTMRVLLRSSVPCALVEVGFITNEQEAQNLSTEKYQDWLAHSISRGIQNYLVNN